MPQMQGLTEGEFLHLGLRERKFMKVKVSQLCPTFCNPMDDTVPGILQDRIMEWVAFPFLPDPLEELQGIFPTQGSNPGLPHCRQILNQLSQKESYFQKLLRCL